MNRLSRLGLGTALAVLLAAPAARAADPDKLIPAEADTVVSVNVKQIVESEIIKKYALEQLKQALQQREADKFLKDLGLDPLKDIDRLVIGTSGKDQSDMKVLAIVHGKFDPEKLYKAAEAQTKKDADHFSLVKDGKDTMFKYQPDNGNPVYGTVVDETTVVLGNEKKIVSTALAVGAKKTTLGKDLTALVTRMDDKASVWLVSVVKGKLDNVKLPGGGGNPNVKGQIEKMETVTAVIRVTTDVALDVSLGMKDGDAAEEFGKTIDDGLTQLKGLLPLIAAQQPQMKPVVEAAKSIKTAVKDKSVTITAKLPGSAIGELLKQGGGD